MPSFASRMPATLFAPLLAATVLATAPPRVAAGEPAESAKPPESASAVESVDQRIARLIEELGHPKYAVRERAQQELAKLGFEAYDALSAATEHEDLEIATRAKYLLLAIPAQWNVMDEPEEVRQCLSFYKSGAAGSRVAWLRELARLPDGIGLPALCRLVRFEKSKRWSKQAAIVLLDFEPVDPAGRERWAETVREYLAESTRPAAQWVRTYLELRDDPNAALARWAGFVEAEQKVLRRSPDESDARLVASLLYYQALARAEQGKEESAEKTAREARQFAPIRSDERLSARIDVAGVLRRRGKLRWAELEYREAVDTGSPAQKARAGLTLSEMLHDAGQGAAAADVLDDVLAIDDRSLKELLSRVGRSPSQLRGRASYFRACDALERGDREAHRKLLDKAIEEDPGELDALIARHQLADADPEFRRKTSELIEKAAASLHRVIEQAPDDATYYNQYAWLVGNTEGDSDEALRCARKAVELEPDTSAYRDTLAHVLFARGELEAAVKQQARAAEMEPHSGLIAHKLKVFRKALEEAGK